MAATAAYADKTTVTGAAETKPTPAEAKPASVETTARPAADNPDRAAAGNPAKMAAAWRSGATLPTTLLVDSLEFGSQRMLAHAVFWQGLMSSTSLPDVLGKQAAFVNDMVADYRKQAQVVARKIGLPKSG